MTKPSVALILKAYEKFGKIATVSTFLKIDDSEVLAALAEAPPGWIMALANARTLDTFIEALRHLRKCVKSMRAPSSAGVVRDLGKLLVDFQAKKQGGGQGPGLGLTAAEEKRLEETMQALGAKKIDHSND